MTALKKTANVQTPRLFDNLADLLTLEEVATFLGKDLQTIRNWIGKRTFPFVEVGNQNMVLKRSLMAWLEKRETTPWQSRK